MSMFDMSVKQDHCYTKNSQNDLEITDSFDILVKNFKAVQLPSDLWVACYVYGYVQWSTWKKDLSAVESQVIICSDMTVRVILAGRQVTIHGFEKIKYVKEIDKLLQKVSTLLPCESTAGGDTSVKDCIGYVFRKNQYQRGPQVKRCNACKKHHSALLKKNIKIEPLKKLRQKTVEIRGRYQNIKRRHARLRNKIAKLKRTIENIKKKCAETNVDAIKNALSELPPNQREAINACLAASKVKSANGIRYTNAWIYECLLIRIKSSKTYDHLRKHKILALPSSETLNRYIKVIEGSYGFDENIFKIMKEKTGHMATQERHGILLVDEMKLTKSVSFNRRNLKVQGFTNLGKYTPKHQAGKKGDHALVLMFQPFQGKWVQSLACFLSKGCASGTVLQKILLECTILSERAGLYVDAVASDGASWNRAMWNQFGMTDGEVSVPHVVDPERRLWFFSDFPHLIKNTRNFFTKKRDNVIWTPDGTVDLKHWKALLKIENPSSYDLKVNFKLRDEHINPQYYQKMNVALAFQFFGIADGMELSQNEHPDLKDSAGSQKFCRRMKKLIKAMNSRIPRGAMRPHNEAWSNVTDFLEYLHTWENEAKANDYEFLTDSTCYGLKVSLRAALEICRYLTDSCGFEYLMTARLNQDNLERFFGMMRSCCGSNDHPDSTLFIQMYRLISTYSLIKSPKGGNISGKEIVDVLLSIKDISNNEERKAQWNAQIDTILDKSTNVDVLRNAASMLQEHDYFKCNISTYVSTYVAGYVARKAARFANFIEENHSVLCKDCLDTLELSQSSPITEQYKLIQLKSLGYLKNPSLKLAELISVFEENTIKALKTQELNAETLFNITENIENVPCLTLVGCSKHKLLLTHSIIRFFLTTRMYFICKQSNQNDNIENQQTKERRKASKLSHATKQQQQLASANT